MACGEKLTIKRKQLETKTPHTHSFRLLFQAELSIARILHSINVESQEPISRDVTFSRASADTFVTLLRSEPSNPTLDAPFPDSLQEDGADGVKNGNSSGEAGVQTGLGGC